MTRHVLDNSYSRHYSEPEYAMFRTVKKLQEVLIKRFFSVFDNENVVKLYLAAFLRSKFLYSKSL
jgi:hypothetical protein